MITDQHILASAPEAPKHPTLLTQFDDQRTDPYFWMRERTHPELMPYLEAENDYTARVMAPTKALQETLYHEILGRINEEDASYPVQKKGYYYYTRTVKDKQYRIYCRRHGSLEAPEEILFDLNEMARDTQAFIFKAYYLSPDHTKAAYLSNTTGSYAEYEMRIRDLATGQDLDFVQEGVTSIAWANDGQTLFFGCIDQQTLRPYQIYRRALNEPQATLIYEETDARFTVVIATDVTRQFTIIASHSSTTSEYRILSADEPLGTFRLVLPREQDVEYSIIPHLDRFFIYYKDKEHLNGMLYTVAHDALFDRHQWQLLRAHDPAVRIDDVDVLQDYLILNLRRNGLNEIRIYTLDGQEIKSIAFPEPVYSVEPIVVGDFDNTAIRYSYTSFNRPHTLYEYNILTQETVKLKEQIIPSGFDPDAYTVERLWATAPDQTAVPMAIIYRKGMQRDGSASALLYAYGSYGITSDIKFSSTIFSLVDRGFVFGIAQVRGGSDLGEHWYENGKLLKKENTFHDFIACTEKLIHDGYTSARRIAAMGGSAGGMLMGVIANRRPDLYGAIVAQVPFVDVLSTMLDDTLPLTTGEYEEWGNPNDPTYYHYMRGYSPYDNIQAQDYPHMLVTGGLNDSQVLYHEPTKYVAKLRALKTDHNCLLLHMDMASGHGGATGRYDSIRDLAFEYAFILATLGNDKI